MFILCKYMAWGWESEIENDHKQFKYVYSVQMHGVGVQVGNKK